MNKNPNQQYDDYLREIILDFERNRKIHGVNEPGFNMEIYYAGLRMNELKSRLQINITYCQNHNIISDGYKEAKKIIEAH